MKRIKSVDDLDDWHRSVGFNQLQEFLSKIYDAVKGKSLSDISSSAGPLDCGLWAVLAKIEAAVEEIEALPIDSRYGNKAFRTLHARIESIAAESLSEYPDFMSKLLAKCFGDPTRLDYGTGHELAFIILCHCHIKLQENCTADPFDYARIGAWLIGNKYLNLVRKIQQKYSLEPAGSHGVWGLDDYQFIPFILGSAQLAGRSNVPSPSEMIAFKCFSDEGLRREFLYPAALHHIHCLKTRANPSLLFHHHSPLLYDISGVPTWQKIHEGLRRMYDKEVLSKFPVVQHILFDEKLFPFEPKQ